MECEHKWIVDSIKLISGAQLKSHSKKKTKLAGRNVVLIPYQLPRNFRFSASETNLFPDLSC